jgi:c(7)-type cytochrome triheme protein
MVVIGGIRRRFTGLPWAHGLFAALALLLLNSCQTTKEPPPEIAARIQQVLQQARSSQETAKPPIETSTSQPKALSLPKTEASESPRNDGIHDPENNAIAILQDPAVAMADFPRDRRQQVDWVQAISQGLIAPRADLLGEGKMQVWDRDIIMKNTQHMPWVRFPHKAHTQWLACDNCHPAIFAPKEGANAISMNKVLRGEYCGVCHDKVAFSLFICERCHSVPHAGSGKKWW